MKKSIFGLILMLIFIIPACAFAEEFGNYTIDKNTKLNVYTTGFHRIAYRVRGNIIYKGYDVVPSFTIDGKHIKRYNIADRVTHPSYSFNNNYIYSPYGVPLFKIKGDKLYGGMGFLTVKYKIERL